MDQSGVFGVRDLWRILVTIVRLRGLCGALLAGREINFRRARQGRLIESMPQQRRNCLQASAYSGALSQQFEERPN